MKVKNKHPVLSDFLREKHPPYEQIDSKSIKTTSTMPYKDAEEASQVKDLTNFNHFRKWQSIVKIVSLVVFSMVILVSICAMYYVALDQFFGSQIPYPINMAWLVQDTCIILMGAIFGLFIKDIFK